MLCKGKNEFMTIQKIIYVETQYIAFLRNNGIQNE